MPDSLILIAGLGGYTGGLRAPIASLNLALLACLAACSTPALEVEAPAADSFRELKWFQPPPLPELAATDTDDEAEIQFRAAYPFYRGGRWRYAAAALAEALDYDERRDDIRYFLICALLKNDRGAEIPEHVEELAGSPYEAKARHVAAIALLRQGQPAAARAIIAEAAVEDYVAAGWLARLDALQGAGAPLGQ